MKASTIIFSLLLLITTGGIIAAIILIVKSNKGGSKNPSPRSKDNKAGYACEYANDATKTCGDECKTKAGCLNADPNCCFTANHNDPDGMSAWCYYPEDGTKCYSQRMALENYYSFGKTVTLGGVIPPIPGSTLVDFILSTDGSYTNNQLSSDDGVSLPYQIVSGDGYKTSLLDWDASSGGLCGNSWGTTSGLARIYFNMLSYSAPDPIINRDIYTQYLDKIIYNTVSYSMINQGPECIGMFKSKGKCIPAQVFQDQASYNAGFMELGDGWGHYGETYGYTTCAIYFPNFPNWRSNANYWPTGSLLDGLGACLVGSQNAEILNGEACSDAIYKFQANGSKIKKMSDVHGYLYQAIIDSLNSYLLDPATEYKVDMVMSVSLYAYDPKTKKDYTAWASACVMKNSKGELYAGACGKRYPFKSGYLGTDTEPKYYFGSGTKPVTSQMVVNAVYDRVWNAGLVADKAQYDNDFITWYAGRQSTSKGNTGLYGINALTMGRLQSYTDNFWMSNYQESITKPLQAQFENRDSITMNIQDLLFTVLYTNKACDPQYCSRLVNVVKNEGINGQKCDNCPSNMCIDIDSTGCKECGSCCSCPTIQTSEYADIFKNMVSLYDLSMMRAGIPDADSVGFPKFKGYKPGTAIYIDTLAQNMSRTHPIGSVEYLFEIPGFEWKGGWYKKDDNMWWPRTTGTHKKSYPAARYTSSGFTLLGTVLWLLDNTDGEERPWQSIDLNQYLPKTLQSSLNFAGTSGNSGTQYMVKAGSTHL